MPGFKYQAAISSGEQTSSTAVLTGSGCITGIKVITDGTNDATLIVYDNTAASGTVVDETKVNGANHYGGRNVIFPIKVDNGIYAAISGTGASYIIEYIPNV